VDFRGDGRRDIWSDNPTDALASAAAYLARSGWRRGQPWGIEVRLPGGFPAGEVGRRTTRPVAHWTGRGVRGIDGAPLPDHGASSVLRPAGAGGPAFLVFRNFGVILRYNNAESYGIGVGHLSDRIAGGAPVRGRFPPDSRGMTIDDRRELQVRLSAAGFDTAGADGVVGGRTREAIEAFERRAGLPVTGEATPSLLARLR
jgi:membrane-bound lytic murein transglycosylase B